MRGARQSSVAFINLLFLLIIFNTDERDPYADERNPYADEGGPYADEKNRTIVR